MYNDVGTFTAEFQAKTELNNLIEETDYVVFDEDTSNTVMIVWGIELRENKIIISGDAAVSLFDNRISQEVVKNQKAEVAMRQLVANMTPWNCVENGELKDYSDKFARQKSDDTILNYLLVISQECDMGFTLQKNGQKLLFECYKPTLNTAVVFNAKFGNIVDEKYSRTEKEFRNVAVVAGMVDDTTGERVEVTVGETTATGAQRREMYVDARDLQQNEGESFEEYQERLRERGTEKLSEQIKSSILDFALLEDDVRLGDIVAIKPTYDAATYEARVKYITYKSQNNMIQKNIGIGTLIPRKRGR